MSAAGQAFGIRPLARTADPCSELRVTRPRLRDRRAFRVGIALFAVVAFGGCSGADGHVVDVPIDLVEQVGTSTLEVTFLVGPCLTDPIVEVDESDTRVSLRVRGEQPTSGDCEGVGFVEQVVVELSEPLGTRTISITNALD